jgi:hypothetical protein
MGYPLPGRKFSHRPEEERIFLGTYTSISPAKRIERGFIRDRNFLFAKESIENSQS